MFEKECRICGVLFMAKTQRRQLCDKCQKDPARAQEEIDRSIRFSKWRLGEMPSQQYYAGICKYCGKEFHSYGHEREFCGNECAREHRMRTAVCPICKKQLYPLGIIVTSGEKCCSAECTEEYKMRDARSAGKAAHCKECGKEFIQKKDWDEFCCKKCEKDNMFAVARAQGKAVRCRVCGKEFISRTLDEGTCSTACYEAYRKALPSRMIECKCEICGKPFQRHINATQYTCGKECATVRRKAIIAAEKEKKSAGTVPIKGERPTHSAPEAKRNTAAAQPERERLINGVISGAITGADASKLHLCTQCRTSQKECEWFSSRFSHLPQGAVAHMVNRQKVVLVCPKYH